MIVGAIIGLQKAGPLCGSPLIPQSRAAEVFDTLHHGSTAAARCYRAIDSAASLTWMVIVLGVVLVLAAVIIRIITLKRVSNGSG